jgi:predicted GNAT family acetyltransferase
VIDDHTDPTLQLLVVNETASERYDAIVGDRAIGSLSYKDFGSRVVLLATTVDPDYRGRGVATQLVRLVLDGLLAAGKTVTIECPIVRTFIDRNPAYEDLVDRAHPGLSSHR